MGLSALGVRTFEVSRPLASTSAARPTPVAVDHAIAPQSLTDAERSTVCARIDGLGPDRVGDVVLGLEGATLAAWIADPSAK